MCKDLQAGGEGKVEGTEGANAQRHEGLLERPEKGLLGQEREASLTSDREPQSSGPQGGSGRVLGTRQSLWGWRKHPPLSPPFLPLAPLVPFLGKRGTTWGPGAFSEARGASDAPALQLPVWQKFGPQRNIGGLG